MRWLARTFIGLGSNLGHGRDRDPIDTLRAAVAEIRGGALRGVWLERCSRAYATLPVGPPQPQFVNAVAELSTARSPAGLLAGLLTLEARFGRQRSVPMGPRTLDLDLLVYYPAPDRSEAVEQRTAELELPHPRMHQRDFVLAPLAELSGDLPLVDGQTAAQLLERIASGARTIVGAPQPLV